MSDEEQENPLPEDLRREEWIALVEYAITRHPKWAAATVTALQQGINNALLHQQERTEDVSMALWEALRTKPHYKRRDHEMISNVYL